MTTIARRHPECLAMVRHRPLLAIARDSGGLPRAGGTRGAADQPERGRAARGGAHVDHHRAGVGAQPERWRWRARRMPLQ